METNKYEGNKYDNSKYEGTNKYDEGVPKFGVGNKYDDGYKHKYDDGYKHKYDDGYKQKYDDEYKPRYQYEDDDYVGSYEQEIKRKERSSYGPEGYDNRRDDEQNRYDKYEYKKITPQQLSNQYPSAQHKSTDENRFPK